VSAAFGDAFRGKRVLVTGDTGFKGAWLSWWLHRLGAEVHGLALPPRTEPNLFLHAGLGAAVRHLEGDIRDPQVLQRVVTSVAPDAVFHLAAQAIVRESYESPLVTIETNVLGTAHLLEAVRQAGRPCAVVVVTSDKCYENNEWEHAYRENDNLGGHDPYSASKGCAELVTASYRRSFFPPARLADHGVAIATARAGNVIGPGDHGRDRIVPDSVAALAGGRPLQVRNPDAIRPWQHVLECLSGYLWLGARLLGAEPARFCEPWNFGPGVDSCRTVRELVEVLLAAWGEGAWEDASGGAAPHEAKLLRLSADKAAFRLGWRPVWSFEEAVRRTALGYRALDRAGSDPRSVQFLLDHELEAYLKRARELGLPWSGAEAP